MLYPDDRPSGRLRASHSDREQAVETLKAAYVQDRLTRDEFGTRVSQALAARTRADLAALVRDLPVVAPPAAGPLAGGAMRPGAGRVVGIGAVATAGLWAAGLTSGNVLILLAAMAFSCVFLGVVILVGTVALATRAHRELPPGQEPGTAGYAIT